MGMRVYEGLGGGLALALALEGVGVVLGVEQALHLLAQARHERDLRTTPRHATPPIASVVR